MKGSFLDAWKGAAGAATENALQEKVFLQILKNSQENTCARVSSFLWSLRNF